MLKVLKQRDFALLWVAGFVSLLGDYMLSVALPIAVYELTGSALATGLILIVRQIPRLVLGSVAGVFVDRWNRKTIMVVTNLLRAPLLLCLLLVDSESTVWIVYVVSFSVSTLTQFFSPAEDAMLPSLVGEEDLVTANSLNGLNNNFARLIGPAVGGLVAAWLGLGGVAMVDAATFVVAGALTYLVHASGQLQRTATHGHELAHPFGSVWHEWLDGLRVIRGNRPLRVIFGIIALASLGEGVMGTAFWVYIDEALHGGAREAGWLVSAQAIGGIAGAIVIGRYARSSAPARLLGWGAILLGLIDLVTFNYPAFISGVWLGVVTMAIVGIPASAFMAGYMSAIQTESSDAYRGRVFGALNTTSALLAIIGALIAGSVTGAIGAVPTLTIQCAAYVGAGLVAISLLGSRLAVRSGPDSAAPAQQPT